MAPKRARQEKFPPQTDPQGMFCGMVVFLVGKGVQPRRLQIWKLKLMQMGAVIEDKFKKTITHFFGMNLETIMQEVGLEKLKHFKGNILTYEWLEDSLTSGEKLSEDSYTLKMASEEESRSDKMTQISLDDIRVSQEKVPEDGEKTGKLHNLLDKLEHKHNDLHAGGESESCKEDIGNQTCQGRCPDSINPSTDDTDALKELSLLYNPPDLNRNITEIFGKLINIYRALGDDRRSFSYYKVILVIEKLPFRIESVEQVKHLPAIGKSMQDHIHEIVTTGKLSKLEHFENDEKVRTVTLFGEAWGIGPATALKLYEKGHRSLDDLRNEESLTNAQRLGIKYFNDINQKIPREEVKEMEALLQKAVETILPGVIFICGGSYRRGKAFCGDLDIIITHPDGKSHKGFLSKYVKYLKDIKFLREDLVFSTHSEEGTDSGVDTYFGLCTYPGQDQRHRIDFKVYPRDVYAFGLIAWTGNDVLNRRLRLLAESKGYRLDDTGLFLATQGSHGKRGARSSTSIHCQTEREVFDLLGFPWLEPHERNL